MAAEKASRLLSLNGLFPVYKPPGVTSAQTLNDLKSRLLRGQPRGSQAGLKEFTKRKKQTLKIGHGGTLDSTASGLLVVGVGEGTKMLGAMLTGSKKYMTTGQLGKATDTLDASGTVTQEKPYDHITREELEKALERFTGNTLQVPPLFSALKKNGKRLSCLVRSGAEVEAKPARPVVVYSLTLTDFRPPLFTLCVECGGGFYVRSLIRDIGEALSSCASVNELIRTKQGPFTLDDDTLREDRWDLEHVARALQTSTPPPEQASKRLKTEEDGAPAVQS
ncbi:probable tRNA pseudouridine synthase 1 isoform X1 [Bufo bufo]|uniref:probable tRNA pseudouridine synthase 1 isoform X1 n=1 Tax=Bufo bufo TaxID=8384 RepID=UPI001ABEC442|nr:probable tRNA pseudouridine synthase 1 isoform X1 [Bufo bufo]